MIPSKISVRTALLSALGLCLAFTASVQGQVVIRSTLDGNGSDAYGRRTNSATNFGAATALTVQGSGSSDESLIYLRFDLSGLAGGLTSDSIRFPDLALTTVSASIPNTVIFSVFGLVDGTNADRVPNGDVTTGGWLETGTNSLTFTNAPGRNGSTVTTSSGAQTGTPTSYGTDIGTFTLALSGGTTFTLGSNLSNVDSESATFAANLENFLRADTNGVATLVIRSSVNTAYQFASKENAGTGNEPTLSFTLVPEPGAAGLIALGGLGLLMRRRRNG